jgi:hypothetical protein
MPSEASGLTKRAADRPIAAIFHFSTMPNGDSVHTSLLGGRRLTPAVGPTGRRRSPTRVLVPLAGHGPPIPLPETRTLQAAFGQRARHIAFPRAIQAYSPQQTAASQSRLTRHAPCGGKRTAALLRGAEPGLCRQHAVSSVARKRRV